MDTFNSLYNLGIQNIKNKKIIFCSIVRDCAYNLKHNIPAIEKIGSYFEDYRVIIFENNSKDKTKGVLKRWQLNNKKIIAICNDYNESKYNEIQKDKCYFSPNSRRRIQKYVDYRNLYLDYIENKINFEAHFVIIVDLDVAKIDVKGVMTSFGTKLEWDVITANGYSFSPSLRRRYHDTYALCESGHENIPQSIAEIISNRKIFSHLRKNMPFIRVYSAFGGLAIYKRDLLKGIRYKIIYNNNQGVEVFCEHYSIYKQLDNNGYNRFFINPNMQIYYQRISFSLILKKIKDVLKGYK